MPESRPVLVFDLDDTLFDESTYVESGFRQVAEFASHVYGWDAAESFRYMMKMLRENGRGAVFDRWLESRNRYTKGAVRKCVSIYRAHDPKIELFQCAEKLLQELAGFPTYLVTDGNKHVQQKKVEALGLAERFDGIFITHRYGLHNAKPSTYCFRKILKREGREWSDLLYVGDNPIKDFVSLNRVEAITVRVLTGSHKDSVALPGYDARYTIRDLYGLRDIIEGYQ